MTEIVTERHTLSSDHMVLVKRWEFYAFVAQAFLLIAAIAMILSLTLQIDTAVFRPVYAASIFGVIALTTLPVLSAVARLYYRRDIEIGATILWSIATALLAGTIMLFTAH